MVQSATECYMLSYIPSKWLFTCADKSLSVTDSSQTGQVRPCFLIATAIVFPRKEWKHYRNSNNKRNGAPKKYKKIQFTVGVLLLFHGTNANSYSIPKTSSNNWKNICNYV